MRDLLMASSSSPIPPNSSLTLNNRLIRTFPTKTPQNPTKTTLSLKYLSSTPLLSDIRPDLGLQNPSSLKFYASMASKLAENGRLDEFSMLAESFIGSGMAPGHFVEALSIKHVSAGFALCLKNGEFDTVLGVMEKFDKLGICPSLIFDGSARRLLLSACRRVLDGDNIGEFVRLVEIFAGYRFSVKDVVKPTFILQACIDRHDPFMAGRYASILPHADVWFNFLICEFGKKKDLQSALVAFEVSKGKSVSPNMYIYRSIIDACGYCGDSLKSRSIFEDLLVQKITPNTFVFNSLMNVNAHDSHYALHIYKQMKKLGVAADMASYNVLLKVCCLAGRVDLAQEIYEEILQRALFGGLKLDVITYSTIIKVFADAKMWEMAFKIKDDMISAGVSPNIVTWSSLISACANAGLVERVIQVLEEMLVVGCEPNTQCCNILLNACVESCQFDRAFRIFHFWKQNGFSMGSNAKECGSKTVTDIKQNEYFSSGNHEFHITSDALDPHDLNFSEVIPFKPTVATYNILMKACGTDYYRAQALMDEMKAGGLSPNHISWSILIDICGRSYNMKGAIQAFKSMYNAGIIPDVVAYTTAIKACVGNKYFKMAFSLFEEMKRHRLQPNLVTYNTLLTARSRYGSLDEVLQCLAIYQDMRKAGYNSNDRFLKELLEEWCEGVISDKGKRWSELNIDKCDKGSEVYGPQSLLLEKVAAYLQENFAENLTIDLRGLTKVEARIIVLAKLRMLKENYILGKPVRDDMIIITANTRSNMDAAETELRVRDAVIRVLQGELGLSVLEGPELGELSTRHAHVISSLSPETLTMSKRPQLREYTTRRPVDVQRLKIPRRSLNLWLQKGVGTQKR
ncbi:hypothetical protein AMTRI_Chr08g206910 [Amborella trichopoda]|uniref:PROP1-like PPR domain-containing protein n=1 Tax=Amborella trichopoda TaxID=13333 RepID=W1NJP3_AMBTC|nr:pentatricopeptide repeat-containing protein At5g02830, chloroplastic [Amborella trichopoda]ERM95718.1 hypothetical protein AMTR_s00023p00232870 [Amborella trichopoda]|eukprot:XP_006828302.1 pentatricopeptide repeat-containing protein At5g02830, chloroplastic [Amborella trichopoda]